MKKLLIAFPILLLLLVVGLFALPSLVPSSVYKEKIETQLSQELSREVRVMGEVKLRAFPLIKADTGRVEIANLAGFEDNNFASMDGLSARVKLWPLFSRRVEIARFTLINPEINLEKRADGRSNWVFGDPQEAASASPEGPFQRDGRYAEIDPNIGQFTLENGVISYSDRAAGVSHKVSEANVDFALPSLAATLRIDGDFIYNGTPAVLNMELDSIRGFLDGKAAPLKAKLTTEFASIEADGQFLAGNDIAAAVTLDGDVSDLSALMALVPNDIEISSAVSRVQLAGQYRYENGVLSAKGADIAVQGAAIEAAFKGDAVLKETPSFTGRVEAKSEDVQALLRVLPKDILPADIQGLDILKAAEVSAQLGSKGEGFEASAIDAVVSGDGFTADYKGSADIAETIAASGAFTARADSVPNILRALDIDAPQAKALGSVTASGQVSLKDDIITLTAIDVSAKDGAAQGRYTGSATLADTVQFDGAFDAEVPSLAQFAQQSETTIPYSDSIGAITVSGTVSGQMSGDGQVINLKTVNAVLSGGQINGRYDGSAALEDGLGLSGTLNVDIPSLRALASTNGTQLPPSTQAGEIFGPFSISGQVSGTPETIKFTDAKIVLDKLSSTGVFAVDLTPAKPFANGELAMAGLDLRPYMAAYSAQNPTGEIQPWSQEPIDMSFLKSVDGDFKLTTPNIVLERLALDKSQATAKLRAGVLTADVPNLALYGGLGRMTAILNAAGSVPAVSLEAGLDDLNSNKFLAAVAGFTNATGEGGTVLKVSGQGRSQAEIMSSLMGSGDFKLINGQLSGVDLSELLTGLDQALTSRSLPSGIGAKYQTKFNDIIGLFTIEKGVMKIGKFSLSGLNVLAEGEGEIDLGAQNIDFSLRPRLTGKSASDLAAFGIPVRFTGGFGEVSAGLDTNLLGKIAAERAKAEAQNLVREKIGGQVGGAAGDLLGTVLGGTKPSSPVVPEGTLPTPKPADAGAVSDLLGGLLGQKRPAEKASGSDETDPGGAVPAAPKVEKTPTLEDALGGLFGSTKKKEEPKPDE